MDLSSLFLVGVAFVLGLVIGIIIGRGHERYRIYDNLLQSQDPESWIAAHRVRVGDTARYPKKARSGDYSPTPAHAFPALQSNDYPFPEATANPMSSAPTVLAPKPTVKLPPMDPP